jgi:hypothetical protein
MGLYSPLRHEQTDKGSRVTLYGAVARRTGSGTGFGPTIMIASISWVDRLMNPVVIRQHTVMKDQRWSIRLRSRALEVISGNIW